MSPLMQFVLVALFLALVAIRLAYASLRNAAIHGLKDPIGAVWFDSFAAAALLAFGLFLVQTNQGQIGFKWVMICPFIWALTFAISFTITWWILDTPERRQKFSDQHTVKIGGG